MSTPSAPLLQGLAFQSGAPASGPVELAAQVVVIGIGASVAAGLVALAYRWYVRERVPTGLTVLFGLSVVAVSLVPTGALGQVISGDEAVLSSEFVLRNLAAFALGAAGSSVGRRVGDAAGTDLFAATGGRTVDADVSEIVQTVGRVTSVKLPDEIDDIVGYDPMPEKTKESLSGKRFLFPRRLTKSDLRDRLVSRLKTDYGVGHVDLELGDDGTVSYIAVGSRAAGIGPTLPPSTNAVAIRADPANAASSGDLVQVWETDPLQRVVTGELRGVVDDVVTVAIDAGDTPKLDPTTAYKLVTLPVQDRPDREFASLLRAADETMGTVAVAAGSALVGQTVGELEVTVAAITREDAAPETIPSRGRALAAGDVLYLIAKPDALRRVETAATERVVDESDDATPPADESGPTDADTPDEPAEPEQEGEADGEAGAADATDDGGEADTVEPPGDGPADGGDEADGEPTAREATEPGPDGDADGPPGGTTEDADAAVSTETDVTGSEPELWDPDERLADVDADDDIEGPTLSEAFGGDEATDDAGLSDAFDDEATDDEATDDAGLSDVFGDEATDDDERR